jgi:hypothetical protein
VIPWWYGLVVPNRTFDVDSWDILMCDTVYDIWLERALLCPQFSGCLLQRHGGILVLMLRFTKRSSDLDYEVWMQL